MKNIQEQTTAELTRQLQESDLQVARLRNKEGFINRFFKTAEHRRRQLNKLEQQREALIKELSRRTDG